MRNLLFFVSVFLIVLFAAPAESQTANMLGLYFDEEGMVNCVDALPTSSYVYVVLHNPSIDFIDGIGFEIVISDTGSVTSFL